MPKKRLTRAKLAAELGVSERLVYLLAKEGMPTDSVAKARTWREQNISPSAAEDETLNTLRGDVLRKRARLLDLEYRVRVRDLMEAGEVERVVTAAVLAGRTRLTEADKVLRSRHPDLPDAVIETVREVIREALHLMSCDLREKADDAA